MREKSSSFAGHSLAYHLGRYDLMERPRLEYAAKLSIAARFFNGSDTTLENAGDAWSAFEYAKSEQARKRVAARRGGTGNRTAIDLSSFAFAPISCSSSVFAYNWSRVSVSVGDLRTARRPELRWSVHPMSGLRSDIASSIAGEGQSAQISGQSWRMSIEESSFLYPGRKWSTYVSTFVFCADDKLTLSLSEARSLGKRFDVAHAICHTEQLDDIFKGTLIDEKDPSYLYFFGHNR